MAVEPFAELSEGPRASRRSFRERIPLRDLLLQSFAIVGSVLLAFGINEWRAAQTDAARARTLLQTYQREIAANQREMAQRLPYHEGLVDSLRQLDAATLPSTRALFEAIGWRGPVQVFLTDNARQLSNATGSAALLDFQTAYSLTALYNFQDRLEHIQRSGVESFMGSSVGRDDLVAQTTFMLSMYLEMVVELERYLVYEGYPQLQTALAAQVGPLPDAVP